MQALNQLNAVVPFGWDPSREAVVDMSVQGQEIAAFPFPLSVQLRRSSVPYGVGMGRFYPNNTMQLTCYRLRKECIYTYVDGIGPNQVGSMEAPEFYEVVKWDNSEIIATLNWYKVSGSQIPRSEDLIFRQPCAARMAQPVRLTPQVDWFCDLSPTPRARAHRGAIPARDGRAW